MVFSLLGPTPSEQEEIEKIIIRGAQSAATLEQIIQLEIGAWQNSPKRKWMKIGEKYYQVKNAILDRNRTVVGEDGRRVKSENLADNRLANAFVRKLVDQKVGYLLGKPLSIQTEKQAYHDLLSDFFDKAMMRRLKSIGKEAVNKGIAWLHVYYDQDGNLSFKKMRSEEIIPLWADEAHTVLDAIIRDYEVVVYEGLNQKTVRKIEWWDTTGVRRYVFDGSQLIKDVEAGEEDSHFKLEADEQEQPMNWERVPFICWKYNEEEQPLVEIIKSLVDDYDRNKSDNSNNLEDLPDSLYVVKGYGGSPAGEIRKNMSRYRIIKIDDPDGNSGVETINLQINTEAYKTHMEQARKDIYEFGRGVDTQAANFGSAPSGIALRFLYSDLDLDASLMETEFQASLEQLRWFIDTHLYNTTNVDYSNEDVEFVFNRDMPIDEESIIKGIKDSVGILSDETLVAQHPYVRDVQAELDRKAKEKEEAAAQFAVYGGLGGGPDAGAKDDQANE
ncbi:phage portal protein [Paenibacillus sp. VCA1]|uniref:phage portal protein n=1 Tax=Paenibacillus sp. VCA1 TaxID=3039148 RepID=UPI002872991B|nr:phage portal protein [Paenibacillus sp. VCA1]MDR9857797.1 phage portal protein [Paenibacillus sp. VCA1]